MALLPGLVYLVTICDLVTVSAETKTVTKSRLHCNDIASGISDRSSLVLILFDARLAEVLKIGMGKHVKLDDAASLNFSCYLSNNCTKLIVEG